MKNKFITILPIILSLFVFSCNNSTEPPVDEQSLLTGKIVFLASTKDTTAIYTVNPDGTELKKLTTTAYSDEPVWSPDGKQIAFIGPSLYNFTVAIYIMNADGSNVHPLSIQPGSLADGFSPDWSPDGSKIAYTHYGERNAFGFAYTIIVSLTDGKVLNLKTDEDAIMDFSPKWSPDGKKIIFLSNRDYINTNYSKSDIYLMDADGKNIKRLTQYGAIANYLWEPSDQSIIFSVGQSTDVTANGIGRVDTAGNLLWFNDMPGVIRFGKLSNDGKRLAFSSDGEIQILDIQSKSVQQVLVNGISGLKYNPVDWSIDDKELLVVSITLDTRHSYLYMINIKKGTWRRLVQFDKIQAADWYK